MAAPSTRTRTAFKRAGAFRRGFERSLSEVWKARACAAAPQGSFVMSDGLSKLDLLHLQAVDPPIRDYQDCMIYPFVSLQKNRTEPIEFNGRVKGGTVHVKVQALNGFYIASIWDWDFLLAVTAHLNDAVEVQRAKETLILPSFRQHGRNSGVRDRACG